MKPQNKKSIGELVTFPFFLVPRKLLVLATFALYLLPAFGQTPEKMSYQAVIRNSSDALVTNTEVGMQISILQGSESGTAVYVETQTPTTNANGLVSIEIGGGIVVSGDFTTIDWANGPYFIKTETDLAGGTNYSITGTSQLLSVPYALHAKTAETITGGITETDPVFEAWDKSTGISITESQISDLGNYVESETDPEFNAWDKSSGILITESQISNLQNYLTNINDQSIGNLADVDLTGLTNGKLLKYDGVSSKWIVTDPIGLTETDPVFVASPANGIANGDITNWNTAYGWGNHASAGYLTSFTETDPAVSANFNFTGAVNGDLLQFNGTKWVKVTPNYISDYTVTESDVTAHQAALAITESQITDLGNYLETETDPAVSANFNFTGAVNGDLLQFNGTKWVKVTPNYISDYTVTESDVTAHQAALAITESQITDLGNYLETETDPAVSANFNFTGAANGDLLQFNGTKWVKVTPNYISDYTVTESDVTDHQAALAITESQITDLGTYLETETDPKIGTNTTNYLPKWNGFAFITGSVFDNGNVGIGTNAPNDKLDVSGNVRFGYNSGGNIRIGSLNTAADKNAFIELRQNNNSGYPYIDFTNDNVTDFDARIILMGDDQLSIEGAKVVIGSPLEVNGSFKLVNGTQGANKVLTSDANGNATWQTPTSSTAAHYVGELYQGGVVIYVDQTGQHGLIMSMIDLSTGYVWSNVGSTLIGATAQNNYNGLSNSNAIIAQGGHTTSAAKLCLDYTNANYGTGTYSDWYLPSLTELHLVWVNLYAIQKALGSDGNAATTEISKKWYWSSTENNANDAYNVCFSYNASISSGAKGGGADSVRAVRAF